MEEVGLLTPSSAPAVAPAQADALRTDVVIIGGGLAGSLAAAMLGRAGIDCIVVDPNKEYPADFRCEKLDGDQVERLKKTGLADEVLAATTPDVACWVARMGMIIDKRPGDQHGVFYAPLVNRVRDLVLPTVRFCYAKATGLATGADRQTVTLADGRTISARLAVLSNGLSVALRDQVGLGREFISRCHSITVGFNMKPADGGRFSFPALTYYAKSPADQTALLTLFPIDDTMRANLFTYRSMEDPWLREFRAEPEQTLRALMPELELMTGPFAIEKPVQIRPIDLYVSTGHMQPGLVLVGDAYATSCPASGNGARKVITDVERLCNVYIPQWLNTPGMAAEKIAAFYADPVKQACDRFAHDKAFGLRSYSVDTALRWRLKRVARFVSHWAIGRVHWLQAAFRAGRKVGRAHAPSIVPALPERGG